MVCLGIVRDLHRIPVKHNFFAGPQGNRTEGNRI
jgi:hypothetical protein